MHLLSGDLNSKPPWRGRFRLLRLAVWMTLVAASGVAVSSAALAAPAGPAWGACRIGPASAAARNGVSLRRLPLTLFGRAETGWAIYAPLASHEIGTDCPPASPGFAAALGRWQVAHRLGATGVMNVSTLTTLRGIWQRRRPFVALSHRACPPPPPAGALSQATRAEGYGGKLVMLRTRALAAYRAMVAAARAQSPAIARDPRLMTIFSAFRSPAYDAARCAKDGNCNGIVRATCSAHRTGLAMDIYLGSAPGLAPDSSADANRLFISEGPAYQWMVRNAGRFGFVNYPFEPWHWEWTGEAP